MTRRIFLISLFISILTTAYSQTSFLTSKGVAVFNPLGMDSARTLPSMAIVKDLQPQSSLPEKWEIIPEFSTSNGKSIAKISVGNKIDLYGNGEVTGPLKRNNTEVKLWNTDNYIYFTSDSGKRLYQSHPWVLGVRKDGTAFGILADNSFKQEFILKDSIVITSDGPPFRMIIIDKQNPEEVLSELADLTGHMNMPPLWALGYQQCRFSYYPESRVKEVATEFRTRKIPCDVIWMDIDYMNNFKVFTFDSLKFPNPASMNEYLHSIKMKSVFMIDPGIKKEAGYSVYDSGTENDVWVKNSNGLEFNGNVWPGECAFPDFTMPASREWWANLYGDFMNKGIDGVWNDMNEPSVFDGPEGTMPAENLHRGGDDLPEDKHLRYHNVYGMLMVKASREGILKANPEKRPFILSRSNFLGGQRYAATWTGDNKSTSEYMKMSIPMSLNLSLSGQPFNGPDVGGFDGNCNAELLAEWMSIGAYFPFFRNHSSSNTIDQEPWSFGEKIENVCRTAINRRYKLLPYMYTLFQEAATNGVPVMRPTFMADITDTTLRAEQQSFLLGDNLLIVPRWGINVKYPKGDWDLVPFEDEDDGYQAFVLQREGSIVPVARLIQSTEDYSTDSITLYINPTSAGDAAGKMYKDSGEGFGYQKGEFEMLKFNAEIQDSDSLKISIKHSEGNIKSNSYYRIAILHDSEIEFSDWSKESVQIVKFIPDTDIY